MLMSRSIDVAEPEAISCSPSEEVERVHVRRGSLPSWSMVEEVDVVVVVVLPRDVWRGLARGTSVADVVEVVEVVRLRGGPMLRLASQLRLVSELSRALLEDVSRGDTAKPPPPPPRGDDETGRNA